MVQSSRCRACNTHQSVRAVRAGAHRICLAFLLKGLSEHFTVRLVRATVYCNNAFYRRPHYLHFHFQGSAHRTVAFWGTVRQALFRGNNPLAVSVSWRLENQRAPQALNVIENSHIHASRKFVMPTYRKRKQHWKWCCNCLLGVPVYHRAVLPGWWGRKGNGRLYSVEMHLSTGFTADCSARVSKDNDLWELEGQWLAPH